MSNDTILALSQLGRDLDAAVRGLGDLEGGSVAAEVAFKVAHAKAFLNADGSVPAREAQATIQTAQHREAHEVAAAAVRVQREHIKSLHARIDVGRSLLTTERQLAGVGT